MKYFLTLLVIALPWQVIFGQSTLTDISLRGIQIGTETDLTIKGRSLKKGSKLVLPFEFKQQIIEENGNNLLTAKLLIDDAEPGTYPLRILNEDGVSNSILIGVDRLPHRTFEKTKQELPVALTGKIVGAQFAKTSFSAKRDQIVVLECEAKRFGSKLRPVIRIYDSRGKQVAFSQPMLSLGGDARCKFVASEDGEYFVEIHDFSFRGASPGFFQLKIGEFDFADICYPIGSQNNSKSVVRMIKHGLQSEFLAEQQSTFLGWNAVTVDGIPKFSGIRPLRLTSTLREHVETQQSLKPSPVGSVPVAINGRLEFSREIDRYVIDVTPGAKLRFDLIGRRVNSPIDARIILKNESGKTLATNDDRPGQPDALLDYNVPDNLKKLIVEISDITSQGSKSHVYRLSIAEQMAPSVVASVPDSTFNIVKNSTVLIPVSVSRQNYSGELEIQFLSNGSRLIPNGLSISGNRVAANSDIGLLTITNKCESPTTFSLNTIIKADGKKITQNIVSEVQSPETATAKGFSVDRKHFITAPISSKQLDVQWFSPVGSTGLLNGGQLKTKVILNRSSNLKGVVRLRLVTNQRVPKKRIRKNNKDTFVDDIARTLRSAPVEVPETQTVADLIVNVPTDLPTTDFDAVVVAELLSPDKKTVLLSASTPTQVLRSKIALEAKLASGKLLSLPNDGSVEWVISGTITRSGIDSLVRVSIGGLPKGIDVSPFEIPKNQSEFRATFKIPVNAELLKLKKLSLEFTAVDGKQSNWPIAKSKPINVKVKAAPKPKGPGPK